MAVAVSCKESRQISSHEPVTTAFPGRGSRVVLCYFNRLRSFAGAGTRVRLSDSFHAARGRDSSLRLPVDRLGLEDLPRRRAVVDGHAQVEIERVDAAERGEHADAAQ